MGQRMAVLIYDIFLYIPDLQIQTTLGHLGDCSDFCPKFEIDTNKTGIENSVMTMSRKVNKVLQ